MLIRSQDRDTLINLDNLVDLEIQQERNGYHILANYGDEYCADMGVYGSRSRCQTELSRIEVDYVTNPNSVHNMTEDDRT